MHFQTAVKNLLGKCLEPREVKHVALIAILAEQSYERVSGAPLELLNF